MKLYRLYDSIVLEYDSSTITTISAFSFNAIKRSSTYVFRSQKNPISQRISLSEIKKKDNSSYTEIELDDLISSKFGLFEVVAPGSTSFASITGEFSDNASLDNKFAEVEGLIFDLDVEVGFKQDALGFVPEDSSNKGASNGYAPLGIDSKIPAFNSRNSNVTYNAVNGILTFTWADGSEQTIDLPIELLIQSSNYNSSTKELTFTTNGGGTTVIPLDDLVDLPEIVLSTSSNPSTAPTTGQKLYIRQDNGAYWSNVSGVWVGGYVGISSTEKASIEHSNRSVLDLISEAFTTALKTFYDSAVSSLNTLLSTGQRLITSDEIIKLSNTSGTNSGDETTVTIRDKRPLKTVNNKSIEGSGNVQLSRTNQSIDIQVITAATDTYLTGSAIDCPTPIVGTIITFTVIATKTAAGTVAPIFRLRFGTNGSLSDTHRLTFTGTVQTAVVDTCKIVIEVLFTKVGASGIVKGVYHLAHNLSTTGFANVPNNVIELTSAEFDTTVANLKAGISVNSGTGAIWNIKNVKTKIENI
jgi:hypothetical protein